MPLPRRIAPGAGCLLLLLIAIPCAAEDAAGDPGKRLEVERCRGFFLVIATVSGDAERSLALLLDTGASHTTIDSDSLERVAGKPVEPGQWARFGELRSGDVKIGNLRAKSAQLDHLQRALGYPLDGILGFPTFADMLLVLDYGAGEVRLEEGSLPRPDGRRVLRLVGERRRPFVKLRVGTETRNVLLDSGSVSGLALRNADRLRWIHEPRPVRGAVRYDRIEVREAGRLADDLVFGTAELPTPAVDVTDGTELMGNRILDGFRLTFDQRRRRVKLEQQRPGPIEPEVPRGTGMVLNPREEGLRVERVLEGFPAAAAGVRPGDTIVAVDGRPVYEGDRCAPPMPETDSVRLTLLRDTATIELEVDSVPLVPLLPLLP